MQGAGKKRATNFIWATVGKGHGGPWQVGSWWSRAFEQFQSFPLSFPRQSQADTQKASALGNENKGHRSRSDNGPQACKNLSLLPSWVPGHQALLYHSASWVAPLPWVRLESDCMSYRFSDVEWRLSTVVRVCGTFCTDFHSHSCLSLPPAPPTGGNWCLQTNRNSRMNLINTLLWKKGRNWTICITREQ